MRTTTKKNADFRDYASFPLLASQLIACTIPTCEFLEELVESDAKGRSLSFSCFPCPSISSSGRIG